jgi:4-amino-4-deoxy-L-arabinose transferase-like glycosyltransferase
MSLAARPDAVSAGERAEGRSPPFARAEMLVVAAIAAIGLALRVAYSRRLPFDTDEPQHLHVAWAMLQGWVPYRDFFDNHTPLFHLLAAPLVAALGERPDILLWMRLAMVPLVGLLLWGVYRIGAALFSMRTGLWAAAVVSLVPDFFVASVQFRADVLWAALWMACVALWAGGDLRPRRAFALGLLVGVTFVTSVKTILLVPTFAAAWVLVSMLDPRGETASRAVREWRSFAAFAAGATAVIALMLGACAALGALQQLLECLLTHNFASMALWRQRVLRMLLFVTTLPLLCVAARSILSRSRRHDRRPAILFLSTALYFTTLNSFVPLIPRQDFLPFYPLLLILLVAFVLEPPRGLRLARNGAALLGAVAVGELALLCWASPPWRNRTGFQIGLVADVLRLTGAGDPVMDLKGESLFRPRPTYWVLENITEGRMRRGEIPDDIVERLISTRTYVTVHDNPRFPAATRRFLLDNYIPVGHVRVAGKFLDPDSLGASFFDVALPGRYAVLSRNGPVGGTLDGSPFSGSRFLPAGRHVFRASPPASPLALVWANAADNGFSPFHAGDPT